jgi:hypothetical protein
MGRSWSALRDTGAPVAQTTSRQEDVELGFSRINLAHQLANLAPEEPYVRLLR